MKELINKIKNAFSPSPARSTAKQHSEEEPTKEQQWKKAQEGEFGFWHSVATAGYAGQSPEEFLSKGQRNFMLSQLEFLEKPVSHWEDKIVVEFGSGPAGIVEYMKARRKIAVEPLIDKYRSVFPHLADSDVEYFASPGEEAQEIPDNSADLVICFNVLDHTFNPSQIVAQLHRICKPGGDLLLQVNVYTSEEEMEAKSGEHAELHPFSFLPQTVVPLLEEHGFEIWKQYCAEDATPLGEHFFICAGRKLAA
jgi:SAM-dependent methyltransferase